MVGIVTAIPKSSHQVRGHTQGCNNVRLPQGDGLGCCCSRGACVQGLMRAKMLRLSLNFRDQPLHGSQSTCPCAAGLRYRPITKCLTFHQADCDSMSVADQGQEVPVHADYVDRYPASQDHNFEDRVRSNCKGSEGTGRLSFISVGSVLCAR